MVIDKLNKTFKINPLSEADGYKLGHKRMLAPGATRLYGTWIPRSLKYMHPSIVKLMSAGHQFVVRYLHSTFQENFFDMPEAVAVKFAEDMTKYLMLPFDGQQFIELHRLGYLPIRIKALPEGMFTNPNVPHQTYINTVDGYAWLTLYLETYISKLSWQIATCATIGNKFKENTLNWVKKTDINNLWLADFMNHDFHARGGNPFTSIVVGLAHAFSNSGSDTLNVISAARYYYDVPEDEVCINSVNASEHSVSCTKIFTVGEKQMIIDWLKEFPTGILSIVADTFDLWKLLLEYLTDPEVKALILARDGKLVIRPDSGDPVDITCGTIEGDIIEVEKVDDSLLQEVNYFRYKGKLYQPLHDEIAERFEEYGTEQTTLWEAGIENFYKEVKLENLPSEKGVVEILWDIFGGTTNDQGYKVLDSHIGMIYGDSINLDRQIQIYERLAAKGFAATNVVLGVGSFTYVYITRDQAGFAAKGAWFEVEEDGAKVGYDIYKNPVTDDGTKKSLKGMIAVLDDGQGNLIVKEQCTEEEENTGLLQIIYEDGQFFNIITLEELRNKLK